MPEGTGFLKVLAAMRMRDTPVPIPNTTVKTHTADGTALETARESRRPPEYNSIQGYPKEQIICFGLIAQLVRAHA